MSRKRIVGSNGFTIVELLTVIVVIAILATISIVAFNGITERAKKSQLISDLKSADNQVLLEQVETNAVIVDLPSTVKTSGSNVLHLAKPQNEDSYCINGYGEGELRMSISPSRGIEERLCRGILTGNPAGGSLPVITAGTDYAPPLATWEYSGGVSYDSASGEIRLSPSSSGSTTSPLIRVDEVRSVQIHTEVYATQPSPHRNPNSSVYWSSSYYGSDGVTAMKNTSGYSGNGNAQETPLNQWTNISWSTPLGPGIHYMRFIIRSSPSNYTSDNRYRNVQVTINP